MGKDLFRFAMFYYNFVFWKGKLIDSFIDKIVRKRAELLREVLLTE